MKQTMTTYDIADELRRDENANWSPAGALVLAEYLEELEADTGAEMEFDRVAIRCDWSEYESPRAWAEDYYGGADKAQEEIGWSDDDDEGSIDCDIRDTINQSGSYIEFDGGIIVSSF
jgi:hypothetical protein